MRLLRTTARVADRKEEVGTLIERCAGLDVHKDTLAACVRIPGPSRERVQVVHAFGTTTTELLALRDWLEGHKGHLGGNGVDPGSTGDRSTTSSKKTSSAGS